MAMKCFYFNSKVKNDEPKTTKSMELKTATKNFSRSLMIGESGFSGVYNALIRSSGVLLGYDVGVMSGAIIFIQEDLKITEVQEEVLVGILSIISLLGSLAGGRTSDIISRKWTMSFAAVVFQIGAAIMTFAPTFEILMIGRILAGVGIGF